MSENDSVFNSPQPPNGEFFKFAQIGDAIEGTYIDKREAVDSFGNMQAIFILKDSKGVIHNVGLNKNSVSFKIISERMAKEGITLGHIVGFKYDAQADSKKQPGTKAKVINPYFDKRLIDQTWLTSREGIDAIANIDSNANRQKQYNDFDAPTDATPIGENLPSGNTEPQNEALTAIRNLAKTKGLTNESMTEAEADRKIEEYTEMPLTEEHLTKIIIKLTAFVPF